MKTIRRKRLNFFATAILLAGCVAILPGQSTAPADNTAPQSSAFIAPASCCGPISPNGILLSKVLDSMHVEQYWLPHVHVEWISGHQDRPDDYRGSDKSTHCSAFAAAVALRLGIYMLRPPEHRLTFLASAQTAWFHTEEGQKSGWFPVKDMQQAQALANLGNLVVIAYESPDEHKPGHIAIVRPSTKTQQELDADGPQITQAGAHNYNSSIARLSFVKHPGAWPNGVRIYAHHIPDAALRQASEAANTTTAAQ